MTLHATHILDLTERNDVDEPAVPGNEALHLVGVRQVPARPDESTLQRVELLPRPDPDPEVHVVRRSLCL